MSRERRSGDGLRGRGNRGEGCGGDGGQCRRKHRGDDGSEALLNTRFDVDLLGICLDLVGGVAEDEVVVGTLNATAWWRGAAVGGALYIQKHAGVLQLRVMKIRRNFSAFRVFDWLKSRLRPPQILGKRYVRVDCSRKQCTRKFPVHATICAKSRS